MKFSNFRAFEKHLEGAAPSHFTNSYMIISKDPFECKSVSDCVVGYLLKGQKNPQLCLKTIDCDHLDINELLSDLNSLTFFSERQVFVLQNADKLTAPGRTAIEPFLEKPSPSLFLVITAPSINHATNFYKKGEKNGVVLEIPEEKPWEKERSVGEWVASQVEGSGFKMDSQARQFFVKHMGTEKELLKSELEKLFCYIGDRKEITVDDVGKMCVGINISTVWQLGEAIFRREGALAMQISKALLSEGTQFLGLLRQIRNQLQTEFQICSILLNGGSSNDVAQRFPYMKGMILDRHVNMAQGYGLKSFKQSMQYLDKIEVMAKNSAIDHSVLAELLIARLVSKNSI